MNDDRRRWLDDPAHVTLLYRVLFAVCILLFVADFLYHKHSHFSFEDWPGFHAGYGFVVFVFIVFAGKWLRKIVMRDEDYYDR